MIDSCMLKNCMERVLMTNPIKEYVEKYAKGDSGKFEKAVYPYFNAELLRNLCNIPNFSINDLVGIGLGNVYIGKVSKSNEVEIDCLVIPKDKKMVAIEIKGPRCEVPDLLFGKAERKGDIYKIDDILKENLGEIKGKSLLFSVSQKFQTELDNKILDELRKKFEDNNIKLSQDATILVEEIGNKWQVKCKPQFYIIKKEENKLNIYKKLNILDGKIGDIIKLINLIENKKENIYEGYAIGLLAYKSQDDISKYNRKLEKAIEFISSYYSKGFLITDKIYRNIESLNVFISVTEIKKNGVS